LAITFEPGTLQSQSNPLKQWCTTCGRTTACGLW